MNFMRGYIRKPDMPWRKPVNKVKPEGWDDLLDSLVNCFISVQKQETKLALFERPKPSHTEKPSEVESWEEWAEYEWNIRTQSSDGAVLVNNLNAAKANFRKLSAKVAQLMPVVGVWFKHGNHGIGLQQVAFGRVDVRIGLWGINMPKLS